MVRLLLLVAIAAVAWYLYRRIVVAPNKPPPAQPPVQGQDTITRCAECGVHVPEQAGVRYQEHFFCSPDHLNAYLKKHGQP